MAAKANAATAEAEEDAGEESAAPKKKLPLKTIIIAGAALVIVAGVGTAATFWWQARKAEEAKASATMVKPVSFLELPDLVVNLANPGGERSQFLRVKIALEVPDPAMIPQIQPLMPRVLDAFQTYLRELRPSDLEGSAGVYRLKEELTRRVNAAIEPARINAVLFKEFLVQ